MNAYFTEKELAKLPKWAQRTITTLEANEKYYKRKVAEMIGRGEADSNVTVDISEEYNLPHNSDVIFWINREKRDSISAHFSAMDDPSELRISATGTTRLVIRPISSNVIVVTTKR